jgi:ankyrin repeat protein
LHLASRKGHLELVRLLLKCRANIHARNKENRTPFQEATAGRRDGVMQLLL